MKKKFNLNKDELYNLYINQEKDIWKIAKELNVSGSKVYTSLKEYNIPIRDYVTTKTRERIGKANAIANKGKIRSQEFKDNLNKLWMGVPKTKEHAINIGLGKLGKKMNIESCKKLSQTRKRLFAEGKLIHPMLGKTHSDEFKKIQSDKFIGKGIPNGKKFAKGQVPWINGRRHNLQSIQVMKEKRALHILPIKDTSIEVKIQNFLERLKIDYFKHKYINIEHGYQCDIFIPSLNLVIECDGNYWHKYPVGREIDKVRTFELINKGFKVLRLWENEIKVIDINKFKEKLDGI